VALVLVLQFVGEDFWFVTPVVYMPRALFALPLLITLPAVLFAGPRWMLWTQAACALVVVFHLMGLQLHPFTPAVEPGAPKMRVMSFNVFFGNSGCEAIVDEVAAHEPDVVVFQASGADCDRALAARFPALHVERERQFVLGTRFPVLDVYSPPPLDGPPAIPPLFMRYTLETPLGIVDFYSVHPFSPRSALAAARSDLRAQVADPTGDAHPPEGRAETRQNTSNRERQIAAAVAAAARSTHPVIIAGDTNLPPLSRVYARTLGATAYEDGFAAVGNGFGYTFPARWRYGLGPWMRIDRILAGRQLRFLRFEVGGRGASDHCPVVADLGLAR
jgi:endonuclease/exonuclease/phosphatase (EEP) superfamily protein YafD